MGSFRRGIWVSLFLSIVAVPGQAEETLTRQAIQHAVAAVYSYEYGASRKPLRIVEQLVVQTHDQPRWRDCLVRELETLLDSKTTLAAKDFACRQLQIIPMSTVSPSLVRMLHRQDTAQMACAALIGQEGQGVDEALRRALGQLQGLSLMAVLNLLGDRRDVHSVGILENYADDPDGGVAEAAIAALGKIASDRASEILEAMRAGVDSPRRQAAAVACLRAGKERAARGDAEKARQIYDRLIDEEELLHVRRGALLGRIALVGTEAVPLISKTLDGDDELLKSAALAAIGGVPGENVSSQFIGKLNTLSDANQALLLQALADRADQAVVPVLVQSLASESRPVRLVAIQALGQMGGVSEISPLALCLADADSEVAAAGAAALRAIAVPGADAVIMDIAKTAPSTVQIGLIEALADRQAVGVIPEMVQLARDGDAAVSRGGLKSLGNLPSPDEIPALLDLLIYHQDSEVHVQAFRAVTAVIARHDECREAVSQLVQKRLAQSGNAMSRCSLLPLLSVAPNASSLEYLAAASEDPDLSVRDVGVRTLADYPDPAAVEPLLSVFQSSAGATHRAVALRGCVRLLKTGDIPSERTITIYEQLVRHVSTPAQKRLVLSGLAGVPHPRALELARRLAADDTVKAEAALAIEAITRFAPAVIDFNNESTALRGSTGGATLVDSPIAGKALSLDGADARIELHRGALWSVGCGDFTVGLWLHPESNQQAGVLCVGGYNWRHGWLIDVHSDGSVRLETSNMSRSNNGSVRTPGGVLIPHRWTHVAVAVSRRDGARIFINGHERAQREIGAADLTNREANVVIGGIEDDDRHNFHGHIDEVTICKRCLSHEEVQTLIEPGRDLLTVDANAINAVEPLSPAIGVWKLSGEVEGDPFHGTLRIKGDQSGIYTIRNIQVPLEKLVLDDCHIAFEIMLPVDGQKGPMRFCGDVEGHAIKGQWISTGRTRNVLGRRVTVSLFDGRTFEGWEGDMAFFRIEQGAIVAGSLSRPIPHNTFLATTKEYGDFELRLKARLLGKGDNAGVQFRSRRIPGSHEMIGYQADMGRSAGQSIWTCLYDESRRRCFLAEPDRSKLAEVFRADDWNELTIRCVGRRVQIWLNGYHAIDYVEWADDIEPSGLIGLQIHGGEPGEAWYKDIAISEL